MPGQFTLTRQQQIVNFQAGNPVQSNQLGLGYLYRELILTLRGNFTTTDTAQSVTPAMVIGGDEWSLIKRLDIVVNAGDIIQTFTGEELRQFNMFYQNRPINPSLGILGAGTLGVHAFDSTLVVPFWDQRSFFPLDTLLDSGRLSDFRVVPTWGTPANSILQPNSVSAVSAQLIISSRECYGLVGTANGKPTNKPPLFSLARRFRIPNSATVPQTDEYVTQLPLGNVYRGLMIYTKDENGNDIGDAIDRIKITSGTYVYIDMDVKILRSYQDQTTKRVRGLIDTTDGPLPMAISVTQLDNGWIYVSFVDDGYGYEAIDTYSLSEFKLTLKTNRSIPQLVIVPDQIIPLRKSS